MRAYRKARPEVVKRVNHASYERHREEVKRKTQAYRDANRERVKEWNDEYYRSGRRDPAKASALGKRYYAANRERFRELHEAWRRANPEVMAQHSHARRARKRNNPAFKVTARDWERLVRRYNGCCAYCGQSGKLERDHIIPVSRGGHHSIGNLLPACRACNRSKCAWFLTEWRLRVGGVERVA